MIWPRPILTWNGRSDARNAQIIYVNAPDQTAMVLGRMYYAVNHNLAPVITMSYGACELEEALTSEPAKELRFRRSGTEGGKHARHHFHEFERDSGAPGAIRLWDPNEIYASGGLAVSYPASSSEVTGVGGTMVPFTNTLTRIGVHERAQRRLALCAAGEGLGACIPKARGTTFRNRRLLRRQPP